MIYGFNIIMRLFRSRKTPLVGLIMLLGLFIWWVGPHLPYPFSNIVVRGFIFIAVVFLFGLIMRLKKRKKKKNADNLMEEVAAPDESVVLKKRFKEAIKTLKNSEKSGQRGVLELPWYIFIGPPGTGKTTLLRNAGLNFPLEKTSGEAAVKGVGGTRDCDWWFADEAVLLDTAGRYTTQDSNEETDRKAWVSFLDLLRGRRKKWPINGIFVAISADILLATNREEFEAHAQAVRLRILELYKRLKGKFPVYLIITKMDLISGFSEFFEPLTPEEREQVWGYTQPIDLHSGDKNALAASFDREFELLLNRLSEQSLARLRDEPDARRRAFILGFPEQLSRARHLMREFLTACFMPNAYQETILLRGLYMTSGTQEGAPIDRLMGGLAKALKTEGFESDQLPSHGRSYFVKNVLQKVAFPEQDLLGIGRRQLERRRKIQLGSYIGIATLTALALLSWTFVYTQQRAYVDTTEAFLQEYQREKPPLPSEDLEFEEQARQVILRLDKLAQAKDEVYAAAPHVSSLGLPGSKAIQRATDEAYYGQLERALAPLVLSSLRSRLQRRDGLIQRVWAFDEFEVNLLPEFVRSYGAMEKPRKRLKTDSSRRMFANTVLFDLEDRNPSIKRSLAPHVLAWVNQPRGPSARELDKVIMDGAQENLTLGGDGLGAVRAAYSEWLFGKLYNVGNGVGASPGLVDQIGLNANELLRRRSGRNLNEAIPLIFTRAGFDKFFKHDLKQIMDTLEEDAWVYGADKSQKTPRRAAAKAVITKRYVNDYIRFWRNVLSDVTIVQTDRKHVLRALSKRDSPLKAYLSIVVSNTELEKKKKEGKKRGKLNGLKFGGKTRNGKDKKLTPKRKVSIAFSDVAELVGTPDEAAPIDAYLTAIGKLADELSAIETGDHDVTATKQAKRELETLSRDLEQSATGLDHIIRDIVGTVTQGQTMGQAVLLERKYRQEVLPVCRRKVGGRYPFSTSTRRVVGLRDLEEVFGPNGVMTKFIDNDLDPLIDRSRGGWTWRQGNVPEQRKAGSLRQFERANKVRNAFFAQGSLGVKFDVTPVKLGGEADRSVLTIGDTVSEYYKQTPQTENDVMWPALVSLQIFSPNGQKVEFKPVGKWGLFMLLERASSRQALNGGTSLLMTMREQNLSASYRFDTDSVDNAITSYDSWKHFRCPSRLW